MRKLKKLLKANGIQYRVLLNNNIQLDRYTINFDLINEVKKIGYDVYVLDSTAIIYN